MSNLPVKRKVTSFPPPRSLFPSHFQGMFDNFFGDLENLFSWHERLGSLDFTKTDTNYTIVVDVPGLKKEDISIDISDGYMKIAGERRPSEQKEQIAWLASERSYRRFERIFQIPDDINYDKTDAEVNDGVLTIILGRKESEKSNKKIEIK